MKTGTTGTLYKPAAQRIRGSAIFRDTQGVGASKTFNRSSGNLDKPALGERCIWIFDGLARFTYLLLQRGLSLGQLLLG